MKSLKDLFPNVHELVISILNNSDCFFLSGSHQFGCATNKSDIDVCVPIQFQKRVVDNINKLGFVLNNSNYNSGVKIRIQEKEINFVFLHPVEYVCWYKTAQMITSTNLFEHTKDKQIRHAIHQTLVAMVKAAQTEHINVVNMFNFLKSGEVWN